MRRSDVWLRVSLILVACVATAVAPARPGRGQAPQEPAADAPVKPEPAGAPTVKKEAYAPNEVLVRFRPGVGRERAAAVHAATRAHVVRSFRVVRDLDLVRLPPDLAVPEAIRRYRRNPEVLYVEPNYGVSSEQAPVIPDDPLFPQQWALQMNAIPDYDIDAPEAWALSTGSSSVVVGVLDTGIDYNHPDLGANLFRNPLDCDADRVDDDGNGYVDDCLGIDVFNGDTDPLDDNGHGSHVAGIIGATTNNGIGIAGINWQVQMVACKFLNEYGGGYISSAITCLDYLADLKDHGVNLVATNNSWGGGGFSQALRDAIEAHRQRGVLFIASAGNSSRDNDTIDHFPSNYDVPNVVAVAAMNGSILSSSSNSGRHTVHLGAPGAVIMSTVLGGYAFLSGTSMAAPHVTGAAALLKAQDQQRDWKAIRNLLLSGGKADSSMSPTISRRVLNLYGAMTCSNSIAQGRLQPRTNATTGSPGSPVDLAFLTVQCDHPNGDSVTVEVGTEGETVTLLDDGLGTDQEAGDGVYSGQWTPSTTGTFSLRFPGDDIVEIQVLSPYRFTSVPFVHRDISGSGHWLYLGNEDWRQITPGFTIPFGGGRFESLYVNSAGSISFIHPLVAFGQPIPFQKEPPVVAPFWTVISFGPYDISVSWEVTGTQPNRELVIEWRAASPCLSSYTVTFQVVFFEGSSSILFNYPDVIFGLGCDWGARGAGASVGIQVAKRVGTQFSFMTPSLSDNSSILWEPGNTSPAIERLSPFAAAAGDPSFTLGVIGSNLMPTSVVRWDGVDRPTTFVDSRHLDATVSAEDVATERVVPVSVFTAQAPNGEVSNALPFTIYATYPEPALASVSPAEVIWGSQTYTLSLTGTGFVSGSVVRWNGADRPTTVVSGDHLTAVMHYRDMTYAGIFEVTVFNPGPGGGLSNPLPFAVKYAFPDIQDYSPSVVVAGGTDFTLSIFGWGFGPISVVRWNGSDRPTIYRGTVVINESYYQQLDAAITAADIATPVEAEITVVNPPPGGGISEPVRVHVVEVPPNDDLADAIVISELPFTHTVNTHLATTEPNESYGGCPLYPNAAKSVWYKFTPATTVTVSADDRGGTDYPSSLKILTESGGSWTEVACRPNSQATAVGFIATAGTTYYFLITDTQTLTGGRLVFNLKEAPTISELSPTSVVIGDPDFALTVRGSGFASGAVGQWNGIPLPTTVVDSTEVRVQVSSDRLGTAGGPVPITVANPVPSYAMSNAFLLTVNNAVPVLTSISPSGIPAGSAGFYLTVNGSHFASRYYGGIVVPVVRWNGTDLSGPFNDSTSVRYAFVPASNVAVEGTALVTVFNPAPGGGISNALPFKIGGCGDTVVEPGEQCDPGVADVTLASCCTETCTFAHTGAACTDGDGCTVGDRCQAGACVLGTALSPPPEVSHVAFAADGSTLTWTAIAAPAGTVYDVVRGLVGEWPVGSGASETCVTYGTSSQTASDLALPGEGQAYWYLIRGRHPCGMGSFGHAAAAGHPTDERVTLTCP